MAKAFDQAARRGQALAATLFAVAITVLAADAIPVARAQEATPSILVVDVQQVMQRSSAVNDIQRQLSERREAYQAELKEKEQEIREAEQILARERADLTSEAFAEKRRALERKVNLVQREVQERQQVLAKLQQDAMARVNSALLEVTRRIAEQRNADMVLGKGGVVLVKPEFEITEQVIDEINQKIPQMPLEEGN